MEKKLLDIDSSDNDNDYVPENVETNHDIDLKENGSVNCVQIDCDKSVDESVTFLKVVEKSSPMSKMKKYSS